MLRAGYGKGNVDPKFHEYAGECTRLGIPFGVYWFSYAYTEAMAINDDAKARAEAAAGKCDVPANDEYLRRCAREMGKILEVETDT